MENQIIKGDCLEVMKGIKDNSEYVKIAKARLATVQPNLFASVGG